MDGEAEGISQSVKRQTHVTGERRVDGLADIVVNGATLRARVDVTNTSFVHFLAA